jgi:hypothetical protein
MVTSVPVGRTFAFDPFASCDNGACKVSASSLDQNNCRSGDVLKGAENKKELKILSECKSARGIVHDVHKHMKDGDYNIMISFSSIMGGSSEVDVLKKISWPKLSKFIMAEYTQILQSLILRRTGLFVASHESQPVFFADLYVNCINSTFRRRLGVTEPPV